MEKIQARILVVDDDFGVAHLIRDLLLKVSASVELAGSARECFEQLSSSKPQLIILDVMLPDKNGLEVLTQLRGQDETSKTPVIMISTMTDRAYKTKAAELGANAFLNKPFMPMDLIGVVRRVLSAPSAAA